MYVYIDIPQGPIVPGQHQLPPGGMGTGHRTPSWRWQIRQKSFGCTTKCSSLKGHRTITMASSASHPNTPNLQGISFDQVPGCTRGRSGSRARASAHVLLCGFSPCTNTRSGSPTLRSTSETARTCCPSSSQKRPCFIVLVSIALFGQTARGRSHTTGGRARANVVVQRPLSCTETQCTFGLF